MCPSRPVVSGDSGATQQRSENPSPSGDAHRCPPASALPCARPHITPTIGDGFRGLVTGWLSQVLMTSRTAHQPRVAIAGEGVLAVTAATVPHGSGTRPFVELGLLARRVKAMAAAAGGSRGVDVPSGARGTPAGLRCSRHQFVVRDPKSPKYAPEPPNYRSHCEWQHCGQAGIGDSARTLERLSRSAVRGTVWVSDVSRGGGSCPVRICAFPRGCGGGQARRSSCWWWLCHPSSRCASTRGRRASREAAGVVGLVVNAVALAAALVLYFHWRLTTSQGTAWLSAVAHGRRRQGPRHGRHAGRLPRRDPGPRRP